jgi:hypothetical protein
MKPNTLPSMKLPRLAICLSLFSLAQSTLAQQPLPKPVPPPVLVGAEAVRDIPEEKPFILSFPGGTVQEFVRAVEQATASPFNLIIPGHAKDLTIPPVNVREVTLTPLLNALSAASRETKPVLASANVTARPQPGFGGIEYRNTGFQFTRTPGTVGSPVWQLTVEKVTPLPEPAPAPQAPRIARFYQLKPNLEAGLKVEDITTVARTAWTMMKLDAKDIPDLKVHEETGLLIAVGSESALSVIESVLQELPKKYEEKRPLPPGVPQVPRVR